MAAGADAAMNEAPSNIAATRVALNISFLPKQTACEWTMEWIVCLG